MSVLESLESGGDKLKSVAMTTPGKIILVGGLGLVLYLHLARRSSSGSGASKVPSGVGGTFGLGGGVSSLAPGAVASGGLGGSGAPSLDEQLAYQEKLGTLQVKLQGLVNDQALADAKQRLTLANDSVAAQAAQALQSTKDSFSFWFTPQTRTEQGGTRTIDTQGNTLSETIKSFTSSLVPFSVLSAAQQSSANQSLRNQQAAADIITGQQKTLIEYQADQQTHAANSAARGNFLGQLLGAVSSVAGLRRSTQVTPTAPIVSTPPSINITFPQGSGASSSPSGLPGGFIPV